AFGRYLSRRAVQHRLLCAANSYGGPGDGPGRGRFRAHLWRRASLFQPLRTGPVATDPRTAGVAGAQDQSGRQAARGFCLRGFQLRRLRSASPYQGRRIRMSHTLPELTALMAEVSDTYAARNDIARDDDWYLLKLQEELGELTAEYLRTTARGRHKGDDDATIRVKLEDESADVLAMLLLFARNNDIDLDAALERKWFQYLGRSPHL